MNRRLLLRDGSQWTIRRANPSPRDADLGRLGPVDPEIGVLRIDRVDGRVLAVLHKMEQLIRLRANLQLLERQLARNEQGDILAEIQAIRIGSFALVTFSGEPYCEIGLRIKRQSPIEHTFLVSYANGHVGYGPTAESYATPSYENCHTPLAPEWHAVFEATALRLLRAVTNQR